MTLNAADRLPVIRFVDGFGFRQEVETVSQFAADLATAGGYLKPQASSTFTPWLAFLTPADSAWSFSAQSGSYQQIGNAVLIKARVDGTVVKNTGSGQLRLYGLPAVAVAGSPSMAIPAVLSGAGIALASGYGQVTAQVAQGTSAVMLTQTGSGLTSVQINHTNVTDGAAISVIVSGFYLAG